ncbi:hypothetical protein [Roseisolibacter sp. H3M3-2]|uniref:hypothetical protein n=1 Tax=Roseisolibacter sp. H3M3-2 TaxID=3031323 RepID=UPI0023DB754E|nr:hypothetical protein [Roseisolibacter sp. H3M3-2]MDF1504900.1 hypothetical protein [Roseisolibacter sp. H3M3-2]
MRRALLALALTALTARAAAEAAAQAPVAPGDRVRVDLRPSGARVVGSVVASDADTLRLVVREGDRPDTLAVPTARLHGVWRSAGHRTHVARNALVGAGSGVAAGVLTAATYDEAADGGWFHITPADAGVIVGLAVGVPAAGVGALTGLARTEAWERVPLPAVRTAHAGLAVRPRVGTTRVPVRGAPPARALTVGLTLRPR